MSDPAHSPLEAIAAEVRVCTLCRLHVGRTRAVPGAGSPNAEILFIGEGPGYNEDRQGLPFVGRSGDLLVTLLKGIGLTRADVFIANVVKCRPPENRDPLPDEMAACAPYLDRQEAALDPLVIVTLGRFSMGRYFPKASISRIHGQPRLDDRRAYLPLYHPAAVLRNPALMPEMQADFARIPVLVEQVRALRAAAHPQPTPDDDHNTPPTQLSLF